MKITLVGPFEKKMILKKDYPFLVKILCFRHAELDSASHGVCKSIFYDGAQKQVQGNAQFYDR